MCWSDILYAVMLHSPTVRCYIFAAVICVAEIDTWAHLIYFWQWCQQLFHPTCHSKSTLQMKACLSITVCVFAALDGSKTSNFLSFSASCLTKRSKFQITEAIYIPTLKCLSCIYPVGFFLRVHLQLHLTLTAGAKLHIIVGSVFLILDGPSTSSHRLGGHFKLIRGAALFLCSAGK